MNVFMLIAAFRLNPFQLHILDIHVYICRHELLCLSLNCALDNQRFRQYANRNYIYIYSVITTVIVITFSKIEYYYIDRVLHTKIHMTLSG